MNADDNLEPMIDKELEVEPIPSEASVVAEASPFEIDVQAWDSLTYAFAHNRVPVIRNLANGLRSRMNKVVDRAMATGRLAVDGHGRLIVPRNEAR